MSKTRRLTRRFLVASALATVALALLLQTAAGASVYTANYMDQSVSQFDVGAGGLLSPKTPLVGVSAANPWGMAISPDGGSVYTADYGGNTVAQFDVGAGGLLSPKSPPTVTAGDTPYGIASSPDGQSLYVSNQSGSISQYDVDGDGALSPKVPASVAAAGPNGIVVSPDGQSAYTTSSGSGSVSQFDVDGDGALSPKSPATVTAGIGGWGITITPDGQHVYKTDAASHTIIQLDVGSGGVLTANGSVEAGGDPWGVIVSPDGDSLYATDASSAALSQYDIDGGGALSPKTPASVAAGSIPYALVLAPNGESLYSTSYNDGVRQWDVGAGGLLSPKTPASVSNDDEESLGIVITPGQGTTADATVSVSGNTASFDGSSSTSPNGPITGYEWDFGDGSSGNGATVNHTYAAAGTYTATLTVTDDTGCTGSLWQGQTAYCTDWSPKTLQVVATYSPTPTPGPTPAPAKPPVLSGLKLRPALFRVGAGGVLAKAPRGSQLQFTLSSDAKVDFSIQKQIPGRRVGGRCVKPKLGNAGKPRCGRGYRGKTYRFSINGKAGANKSQFSGRLPSGRLSLGVYRLKGVATSNGANSVPRYSQFEIARK